MGFMFGGKSSKSEPSKQAEESANLLLEAILPGFASNVLGSKYVKKYLESQPEGKLPLPPLQNLARYRTLFEKAERGRLPQFAQDVIKALGDIVTSPPQVIAGGVGTGGVGANLSIGTIPDIGTLTSKIVQHLPDNMKTFINNIFQDSSPEAIDRELDRLSTALVEEGARNAESFGGQLLSQFSALGLGTAGSALNAMKQVAVETAINVNAQIAQARLNALDSLLRARQIGTQLVNILGQLGASEQANIVAGKVAELNAKADITRAQLATQAQLQTALIDANTRLQLGRMDMLSTTLNQILGESVREEEARQQAQLLPYQILQNLATGLPPKTQGGSAPSGITGLGGLLGGILGLVAPPAAAAAAAGGGTSSLGAFAPLISSIIAGGI